MNTSLPLEDIILPPAIFGGLSLRMVVGYRSWP